MKRILTTLALGLIVSGPAVADSLTDNLQSIIRSKAAASERGVIVALSEPGKDAAETAWLLAEQTTSGSGYAPHLLVVSETERQQISKLFNLPAGKTPALLIFDRNGQEISRIIDVRPAQVPWRHKSETDESILAFAK